MPKILKEYDAGSLSVNKDRYMETLNDPNADLVFNNVLIQRSNKPNQNKRIYPREILEKEVNNYKVLIQEKRAYGTLDHEDQSCVALEKVCWLVTDIWMEGDEVKGNIKVLRNHPKGKIIEGLIKDGATIGISSRALGEVEKDSTGQYDIVQSGLVLVSFDAVAEPSTHRAFANPENINESVDKYMMRNEHFSNDYIINRMLSNLICGKDRCDI